MIPRVSIVLPVFNAAATVVRAIESIRAQTFGDWELVVIDDGSTDSSLEILRRAEFADTRIRVITRTHEGIVAALTAGIEATTGGLIARMDADDESLPDRIGEQVALLDANSGIGVAGCLVEFGGDRAASAGYALHVDWINGLVSPEQIALNRFVESPLAHPSVMFRRELVVQLGGYRDGEFPEDYDLWLRWMDAGVRIAKVPHTLLRWNDPPSRLSRTDERYADEAFFRMKAEWIARELARRRANRDVWVWGAGRHTRERAAYLRTHGVTVRGYIDVDPKKTGKLVGGVPVVPPEAVPPPAQAFVLGFVSTRGARELHRVRLSAAGYVEGRDFLMCA
jgi:glycosyltransferase involved in cell wall biosynthesis